MCFSLSEGLNILFFLALRLDYKLGGEETENKYIKEKWSPSMKMSYLQSTSKSHVLIFFIILEGIRLFLEQDEF